MSKSTPADAEFLITDPDQQPDVVLEVPAGIVPIGLSDEGYYSDKTVRCSFCKQRQKHRKGFFALLPDGTKALCGHCCAVQLTSKATVAKIERETERKIRSAKKRLIASAVLEDVPEIIELLEEKFVPVETEMREMYADLRNVFWAFYPPRIRPLGYALGGLRTIVTACEKDLTDAKVEELLRKKALAKSAVADSLQDMEAGIAGLRFDYIRGHIGKWGKSSGYETGDFGFKDGVVKAGKWQDHLGEYAFWETTVELEEIEFPDTTRIKELIGSQ